MSKFLSGLFPAVLAPAVLARAVLGLAVLGLASTPLFADIVPYANVGMQAPVVPLTAASTGSVTAYFAGSNTLGNDWVRLYDVTTNTFNPWTVSSASTIGQAFTLGQVNQGDVLVFQLINYALYNTATNNYPILASDPARSDDHLNHTYVAGFAGSGTIPAGTYIAFEDYLGGYDFDYNDDTFVVTNLSTAVAANTPEPSSLALLGTGLLAGVGVLRRRLSRS